MEDKSAESLISAATGYRLLPEGFDPYCHQAVYPEWKAEWAAFKESFFPAWQSENKKDERPTLLPFFDGFSAIVLQEKAKG